MGSEIVTSVGKAWTVSAGMMDGAPSLLQVQVAGALF